MARRGLYLKRSLHPKHGASISACGAAAILWPHPGVFRTANWIEDLFRSANAFCKRFAACALSAVSATIYVTGDVPASARPGVYTGLSWLAVVDGDQRQQDRAEQAQEAAEGAVHGVPSPM
jgi:hypothetical protein